MVLGMARGVQGEEFEAGGGAEALVGFDGLDDVGGEFGLGVEGWSVLVKGYI